jgi:hypothetical protein
MVDLFRSTIPCTLAKNVSLTSARFFLSAIRLLWTAEGPWSYLSPLVSQCTGASNAKQAIYYSIGTDRFRKEARVDD